MNNKLIELNVILVQSIKEGKNTKQLSDEYITNKIERYFLTNGDKRKKLENIAKDKGLDNIHKNKIFKEIVKDIKSQIGVVYGSFLTQDYNKKEKFLEEDKIEEILKLHKSTKERIDFYDEIYNKIFLWKKPKKIADLACGLNPLSYDYIKKSLKYKPEYFASDLSFEDMDFINSFFEKYNIRGVAKAYDITNMNLFNDKEFNNCDMVFLFKALDSFEEVKKDISKDILCEISAKNIVVSFPTRSLFSKQEFKIEKRNWLFNFIKKKEWKYETFEVENELFILIDKS